MTWTTENRLQLILTIVSTCQSHQGIAKEVWLSKYNPKIMEDECAWQVKGIFTSNQRVSRLHAASSAYIKRTPQRLNSNQRDQTFRKGEQKSCHQR